MSANRMNFFEYRSSANLIIMIFSIVLALLFIDWNSESNVFAIFFGELPSESSTLSSVIATLIPSGVVALAMLFSTIFFSPAFGLREHIRLLSALSVIVIFLSMAAILVKNLYNFYSIMLHQKCLDDVSSKVSDCTELISSSQELCSDVRAFSVGVVACLVISVVYEMATNSLQYEDLRSQRILIR